MSEWTPPTPEEQAAWEAQYAMMGNPWQETRTALSDALSLLPFIPQLSIEEKAIVDAQIGDALALFYSLESPPADIVSLAAMIISWKIST